jgi:nucleotide-binding universal stress UspA family protein
MGATEPDRSGIVAGIDGSSSSLAALEWAARQADLTGSALLVVAAWRLPSTVIEGHPGPVLVDASRDADLPVVGSRGHGELADILLGSVGMDCATHAHCPVLVYRCDRAQAVTAATTAAREPATS